MLQKVEGGTYDLYQLPRETPKEISDNPDSKRGLGLAACFVARNRFAVLDKNGMVYIRNLNNELTKTLKVPNSVDNIFYAGTGLLLLRTEESMALLDIQRKEVRAAAPRCRRGEGAASALLTAINVLRHVRSRRSPRPSQVLAELAVPPVKYVVWSNDMSHVALIAKHCTHARL